MNLIRVNDAFYFGVPFSEFLRAMCKIYEVQSK